MNLFQIKINEKIKNYIGSGGLGNQLFIIWYAYCLSSNKKFNIFINTILYDFNYKKTPPFIFKEFYKYLKIKSNIKIPSYPLKIQPISLLTIRIRNNKNSKIIKNTVQRVSIQ